MKIPVSYDLNGRRRCLLVQDGETISIGRGAACSIQVSGEAVAEVELTAQLVNRCEVAVVYPVNGGVPYAQPLPWKTTLGGTEVQIIRPARPVADAVASEERAMVVQGLTEGEMPVILRQDEPLLVGSGAECQLVISDAGCPPCLLALWAAPGGKVQLQLLDDCATVGWLGRAGEKEAVLEPPLSLSINGRMLLMNNSAAASAQAVVARPFMPGTSVMPKVSAVLPKSADSGPKIISKQAQAEVPKEEAARPGQKTILHVEAPAHRPVVLQQAKALATSEAAPLTMEEAQKAHTKTVSPTAFILFSWLQVGMTYAVAFLPQQTFQLWAAAGGLLALTLLLGLAALLK
ncbi:hypothetical protein [Prosthecobacter vanneervenii]|uniref:Uncharacterized protein n=1 Tax=Prosthecobacter vanneervenii TaxID=48466 RepID=A0A7W7YFV7_9BACT|nr:hypothetical protein [Prosthecobacter vanneervenii]MBB5035384.1 hypothetical protein [Prosthecobacter vanneervenii]